MTLLALQNLINAALINSPTPKIRGAVMNQIVTEILNYSVDHISNQLIEKDELNILIDDEELDIDKSYIITNAVGDTKKLMVQASANDSLFQMAIDLVNGKIGTYNIGTDTFTESTAADATKLPLAGGAMTGNITSTQNTWGINTTFLTNLSKLLFSYGSMGFNWSNSSEPSALQEVTVGENTGPRITKVDSAGKFTQMVFGTNAANADLIRVTGNHASFKGIVYNDDYKSGFSDRSLIDKGFLKMITFELSISAAQIKAGGYIAIPEMPAMASPSGFWIFENVWVRFSPNTTPFDGGQRIHAVTGSNTRGQFSDDETILSGGTDVFAPLTRNDFSYMPIMTGSNRAGFIYISDVSVNGDGTLKVYGVARYIYL